MTLLPFRLLPGQDLLAELERIAREKSIEAACVLTCVGSLTRAVLRFADQEQAVRLEGRFEIVSLTGVLSRHGAHCHISVADGSGTTIGAHLLHGSRVYTTAEIVVGCLDGHRFLRTLDPATGYPELDIQPAPQDKE